MDDVLAAAASHGRQDCSAGSPVGDSGAQQEVVVRVLVHSLVAQRGKAVAVLQFPGVAHGRHGAGSRAERMVVVVVVVRGAGGPHGR